MNHQNAAALANSATTKAAALQYPFPTPPARGHTLEVAPGVHWIHMPIPYTPLDHINLWALDDGAGWAVVDAGTRTEETVATWRELFANAGKRGETRSLTRVLITHMHPDHVGMAGWLTRKFGIALWMTQLEYLNCRVLLSDCAREAPPDAIAFYQRAGWSEDALQAYRARFGNFGRHIHTMPDSFHRLHDGQELRIGAHVWRVIVGSGHSPEHACLHCPDLKLLISGDQVLPRISSNVSVHPLEPEANPMRDWLTSLEKIKHAVDDDVLVLPSHGGCFRGLHARIDALARGQQHALERLLATLAQPRRAVDVFGALFARPISESSFALLGMATGESLACLNYLMHAGQVRRTFDDAGVAWYAATGR